MGGSFRYSGDRDNNRNLDRVSIGYLRFAVARSLCRSRVPSSGVRASRAGCAA